MGSWEWSVGVFARELPGALEEDAAGRQPKWDGLHPRHRFALSSKLVSLQWVPKGIVSSPLLQRRDVPVGRTEPAGVVLFRKQCRLR